MSADQANTSLRLACARRKARDFLKQIDEVRGADFPYGAGDRALEPLRTHVEELRADLTDVAPDGAPGLVEGNIRNINLVIENNTEILGLILRSTNVRNAFEVFFPLERLVKEAVGDDAYLVLSSEWDYIPFAYPLNVTLLPNFVFVGLPASEAGNPFLTPLAGHEIGHAVWHRRKSAIKFKETLGAILQEALEKTTHSGSPATKLISNQLLSNATKQLEEIFCDLFALRIFGDGYAYAFEHLMAPGPATRSASYPAILDRITYMCQAAKGWGIKVAPSFALGWEKERKPPPPETRLSIIDGAVGQVVNQLPEYVDDIMVERNVRPFSDRNVSPVFRAFRGDQPFGQEADLSAIVAAGWRQLRDRGGLCLDEEASEYQMLAEIMLKSIEISELHYRVRHA